MQYIWLDYTALHSAQVEYVHQQVEAAKAPPPKKNVRVSGHLDPRYNGLYRLPLKPKLSFPR